MANIIKPKRTTTPGNTPTTSNLAEGEIAINLADKKLFVRDTSNNILTLPGATDDLTVEGVFTTNDITGPSTTSTNATDGAVKFESQWNYAGALDLSGVTNFIPVSLSNAGDSRFLTDVWQTENGHDFFRYSALDTGNGDDGTHDSELILHGESNVIQSSPEANRTDLNNLTVKSNQFNVEANDSVTVDAVNNITLDSENNVVVQSTAGGQVELSGNNVFSDADSTTEFRCNSGGSAVVKLGMTSQFFGGYFNLYGQQGNIFAENELQVKAGGELYLQGNGNELRVDTLPNITKYEDYSVTGADTFGFYRKNNEDSGTPANDSQIADGTESKFVFKIISADGSTEQLVGGMTATTHSTNGNSYNISLDDQAQTGQVNGLELKEDQTAFSRAIKFYNAGSDPSGLPDGSVYYNDSTHKLRVKANGTWVDLH